MLYDDFLQTLLMDNGDLQLVVQLVLSVGG